MTLQTLAGIVLMGIFASACTKDIALGSDLFANDQLTVKYLDSLSFNVLTEKVDSVLVFNPSSSAQPTSYFLGNIEDATFGRTEAAIYSSLALTSAVLPNFSGCTLDSVVLTMALSTDTSLYYGNWQAGSLNFEVFRVTETLPTTSLIYSNKSYATESTPVLTATGLRPDPLTTTTTLSDTTQKVAYFALKMDSLFGKTLMDTALYVSPDTFASRIKGLYFKGRGTQSALWGLNLGNIYASRVLLYYKDTARVSQRFDYRLGTGARFNTFKHDYNTGSIKPYLNDLRKGDSLLFVQGMAGVNARIEIPNVRDLAKENIAINKAEIEFTVKASSSGNFFGALPQLLLYKKGADGIYDATRDVVIASTQGSIPIYFGGDLKTDVVNGEKLYRYRMAITAELQGMITGAQSSVLYIVPAVKSQTVRNVTLYGAKYPLYRPKLKITYTKL